MDKLINFLREELKISDSVDICVDIHKLTDGIGGWCNNSIDDNIYEIEIEESLNIDKKMLTLCHEMIHVKQYSEGEKVDEDEAYEMESVLYNKYKLLTLV